MAAILSLIIILFLSLLIVRIAAVALTLTGMSRATARFQARSAWTGTGFTTSEAEQVVNHPVRRQIISLLMFLRSAGLVTAASTLVLSFINVGDKTDAWMRVAVLVAGIVALWFFARSKWIDKKLSVVITAALKRYTDLDTRDYAGLLHLAGDYAVMETDAKEGGWLSGRSLGELQLREEGILLLGITKPSGEYIGVPMAEDTVEAGDHLILYGRSEALDGLRKRRADWKGAAEHRKAVREQDRVRDEEESAVEAAEDDDEAEARKAEAD